MVQTVPSLPRPAATTPVLPVLPEAQPLKSPPDPSLFLTAPVKVTGGPYNGLCGNVAKLCDEWCSLFIEFEHRWFEIVTRVEWLKPLEETPAA